ncbi:MAG: DUF3473 domain-containing protein [Alphaproteobacteria bacterium]|nr:DUF3473 domain-containing protein [Alphaproteobacteria bacterium]
MASPPAITFTVNLEDPTGRYAPGERYIAMTRRVLDICDEAGCKATFFAVGRVADSAPDLIRDIAAYGHEIAYYGRSRVPLTKEEPERFRRESRADKEKLEQLAGRDVAGFRAPHFSLTPQSLWALDVLNELGFRYSSSVMPTDMTPFGFADAPRAPFTWPNGMIEFPMPVAALGKYHLPYLGGLYFYLLPDFVVRGFIKKAMADEILWAHAHPYDFDREKKFAAAPGTPFWIRAALGLARKKAAGKIRRFLLNSFAPPLRERLPDSPPFFLPY